VGSITLRPLYLWELPGTHRSGGRPPHFWIIKTNCSAYVRIITPNVHFISRTLIIMFVAKLNCSRGAAKCEIVQGKGNCFLMALCF